MPFWPWYCFAHCKFHFFMHVPLRFLQNRSLYCSHSYFLFGTFITFCKVTYNTFTLLFTIISLIITLPTNTQFPKNAIPGNIAIIIAITTTNTCIILTISFPQIITTISIIVIINVNTTIIFNTAITISYSTLTTNLPSPPPGSSLPPS